MDEEKQSISGCYAFSNWLNVVGDLSEKNKIMVIGLVIYARLSGIEPNLKNYPKKIIPYYKALFNVCNLRKFTGRKKQQQQEPKSLIAMLDARDREMGLL